MQFAPCPQLGMNRSVTICVMYHQHCSPLSMGAAAVGAVAVSYQLR